MRFQILLVFILTTLCLANPKLKKPPIPLTGLYGMRYFPLVPHHFLGLNPLMVYGPRVVSRPGVIKELPKEERPAPYVPQFGDMEKLMGYNGLPMPYGGYGYPRVQG